MSGFSVPSTAVLDLCAQTRSTVVNSAESFDHILDQHEIGQLMSPVIAFRNRPAANATRMTAATVGARRSSQPCIPLRDRTVRSAASTS